MRELIRAMVLLGSVVLVLTACGGSAASTDTPGPSELPPPSAGPVRTAQEAVQRVISTEPRLTGIQPFDSGLIGQSSWYAVTPASGVGAFVVEIEVGWGDCQAGCIDQHTWRYAVEPDGVVRLLGHEGPPVPADAWPSPAGAGATGLRGVALAGPVCPVERNPPDPGCAPRPVAGAEITIRDAAGQVSAMIATGPDGSFLVELPAGTYTVEPVAVEGLMGTAAPVSVEVIAGRVTEVTLAYDTGIR